MEMNHSGQYVLVVCPNPAVDIYATIPQFENGIPNRITKEERYPGGKGLHVAMALAELDIDVVVIGFWGSVTGEWIKTECNRYYPSIRFDGPKLKDWSRSCYTFKSDDEFDDTEILGTGPVITAQEVVSFYEITRSYLPNAMAMNLSGSWPKGAPEDGYEKLIEIGNENGIPSFLDCTGVQLENALRSNPFCIHLNRKEITSHYRTDDFAEAQKLILGQCSVAAITDGSKGLYLSDKDQTIHTLARIDKVISTIGSGDCLFAGVIAGFVADIEFEEIAKTGAASGAANCLRRDLGMLHQRDVYALKEACEVKSTSLV